MSGPVHETLDERIDRVAAALTAVPADPGFGERLAPRLAGQGREWGNRWLFAAAAATAVVVLALVVSDRRDQSGTAPQSASQSGPQSEIASSPILAPGPVTAAPAVAAEEPMVEQVASAAAPAPEFIGSDVERPPAIAALATPDGIGVDTLQLEALHVTPVDVGQIDIASLEVREIDGFEEPKE